MHVHLSLDAGALPDDGEVTVESTVVIDTADPRWRARLQDALASRAHEAAWHLARQLVPSPGVTSDFHPLASLLSQAEPPDPTRAR